MCQDKKSVDKFGELANMGGMNTTAEKMSVIEAIGRQLGASKHAVAKWRQRGVPGKWQIPIIKASDGAITINDFADDEAKS